MIQFLYVTQLVNDNVIDNFLRHQHYQTVEIKVALCAAAAVTRPLISDCNFSVFYTDFVGKKLPLSAKPKDIITLLIK